MSSHCIKRGGTMHPDLETAKEIHSKFEFYLVALTFTIFAFVLQTGELHGYGMFDFLEGASWIALSGSGLLGLWRLEYFPPIYRANWNRVSNAVPEPNASNVQVVLEKNNSLKYQCQKFTF